MRNIQRSVDLSALTENFQVLSQRSASAICAAVVKADGYGLGMKAVSEALHRAGCDSFFVATLAEGEQLRQQLPTVQIYILNGTGGSPLERFHQARLIPVLNSLDEARSWAGTRYPCALHLDTGMQRLGLSDHEWAVLIGDASLRNSINPALLISHLVSAEHPDNPINQAQLDRFNNLLNDPPAAWQSIPRSLANSSGIFLGKAWHFDLCRAGAACYGINPQPAQNNLLQPVVTVSAPILQIRQVSHASTVGYGATASVKPGSRLATIGAGYADGYPRSAGNRAKVEIGEWLAPVVGTVSMDLISIDISDIPEDAVVVGGPVNLVGRRVTADDLAEAAGTIGYEILTCLGRLAEPTYI